MSTSTETLRPRRRDPSPDANRPLRAPGRAAAPLEVVATGYRSPRSRRNRRRLLTVAAIALALATVFGLVLVHVELTANEVRLTDLQSRADAARVRDLKLRLEVAQLESPARIVAMAQQLGMVSPPSITYLPGVPGGGNAAGTATGSVGQSGIAGWSVVKRADTGP